MKIIINCLVSILLSQFLFGQDLVLHDPVSNRTFNSDKFSEIKGSVFLYDKWFPGEVRSKRGLYKDLELKLDLYNNAVYFKRDDLANEFQEEIIGFTIINKDSQFFKRGYAGNGLKQEQFVQVLAEGKISLLRSDIKLVSEMSEINAGIVKTFNNLTRYYIVKNNRAELVKLNKDLLDHLDDQKDMVKAYMEDKKIPAKKESDFTQIFRYYNTLNKQ
jgi:hypothetical protein